MIDLSKCRITPYKHQVIGIQTLVNKDMLGLFDTMGLGKTLQVIVAAQTLFVENKIDRVIVVAPASVRGVWFDPELGELAKHLWLDLPARIAEYHAKIRSWLWPVGREHREGQRVMRWTITNYDFIRSDTRRAALLKVCTPRTLLVLDESSAVKNWKAKQTIACNELRQLCGRVVLLNGTPIANSPGDLYSQGYLLSPAILACRTWYHFRSKYAILGGWQQKQIVGWIEQEDLQRRFAPHVLCRTKEQCLDLPPKLDPVIITVPLDAKTTWPIYKAMKDEMVAWLNDTTVSVASQAAVKALRLAQITSGFAGGLEDDTIYDGIDRDQPLPDFIEAPPEREPGTELQPGAIKEVGREKLNVFLEWLTEQLAADPKLKLLVWCRFRPEVERLYRELCSLSIELGKIWGGQKAAEREGSLRLLDPRTTPDAPVVVIGTPASGSMGLNLSAAHTVVYLSNDYSLKTRLQSEDRVHRPGQTYPVSYFDVIATGPNGQKTIDHAILRALRNKENVATWTTQAWIHALQDE